MRRLCVFVLLVSVLVCPADLSPVIGHEPICCAPCSQEQLDSCPAMSSDCPEVLRESGCGCCSSCALKKGESCGVYTAHCGAGLHCVPRPCHLRPLHALTRGHASALRTTSRKYETSLGGQPPCCWCVSSWNGKRIREYLASDSQCHQELTH